MENDTNYYGIAAEYVPQITSLRDCQQLCVRNLPCAVACYFPDSLGCWLKVKGSFAAPNTGMFCVQKYCPGYGKHIKSNLDKTVLSKMHFKNNRCLLCIDVRGKMFKQQMTLATRHFF